MCLLAIGNKNRNTSPFAIWHRNMEIFILVQRGLFVLMLMAATVLCHAADAPVDTALERGLLHKHIQRSTTISGLHDAAGAGACVLDYDNDGWMDVFFVGGQGQTRHYGRKSWWLKHKGHQLYRNSNGFFVNVSDRLPELPSMNGMACQAADLDNNGYTDLVISGFHDSMVLFNNGQSFTVVKLDVDGSWVSSISIADFNGDGLPDIFMAGYLVYDHSDKLLEKQSAFKTGLDPAFNPANFRGQRNFLWLNEGKQSFTEAAADFGLVADETRSLYSMVVDIDGNLLPDLVVINDQGSESMLLVNEKGKHFSHDNTVFKLPRNGLSLTMIGDGEHIAWWLNTRSSMLPVFMRIYHSGLQDRIWRSTTGHNLLAAMNSFGTASTDLNHDGHTDLAMANGFFSRDNDSHYRTLAQPNAFLYNNGKVYLQPVWTTPAQSSRSVIMIDIDNDGDKEILYTNNNGMPELYITDGKPENWLGIALDNQQNIQLHSIHINTNQRRFIYPIPYQAFMGNHDPRLTVTLLPGESIETIQLMRFHEKSLELIKPESNRYIDLHGKKTNVPVVHPLTDEPFTLTRWRMIAGQLKPDEAIRRFPGWTNVQQQAFLMLLLKGNYPAHWLGLAAVAARTGDQTSILSAIELMQKWQSELSYPVLERLLGSDDAVVRCRTADAFTHFYQQEELMVESKHLAMTPLLINAEKHHDICSIRALGYTRDVRPVSTLNTLLENTDNDQLAIALINALGELRHWSAQPAVSGHLDSHNTAIRQAAETALQRINNQAIADMPHHNDAEQDHCQSGMEVSMLLEQCDKRYISKRLQTDNKLAALLRKAFDEQLIAPDKAAEWLPFLLPGNADGYLLKQLESGNSPARQKYLLAVMQHSTLRPFVLEKLKTFFSRETISSELKLATGDVLIHHQPQWTLDQAKGLFNGQND